MSMLDSFHSQSYSTHPIFSVITVHGLRDNHNTAWKSLNGEDWLRVDLFEDMRIRQLDFFYATDESARVFQEEGIKTEARYLLQSYYYKRRELPDVSVLRAWLTSLTNITGRLKLIDLSYGYAMILEDLLSNRSIAFPNITNLAV